MVFFVSKEGDDANPGTEDKPFATLKRARDAIRALKREQEGLKQSVSVIVRGGKYYLDEPLVLTAEDSGTKEWEITYTAYPGEQPILSGGRRVIGWKPYRDSILHAELPEGHWEINKVRLLTFNGELQRRARWPRPDSPEDPFSGPWATMEGPAEPGSHLAFKYTPGTFPCSWATPQQAEVQVFTMGNWATNTVPIASIDEENRVVRLTHEIWRGGEDNFKRYRSMPFFPEARFALLNVLEALDRPGEWCLDSEQRVLYFWPPEELTENSEVVLPRLDCLLDLREVSHITISGFTFTESTSGDNYHRPDLEGYGAMFPVPGWDYCGEAVHLKNTEHCTLENNRFYALGGNGVYLEGHNVYDRIRRNEFSYIGSNGVCLLGTRQSHPAFNWVVDNHFHHCGVILHYVAAVFAGLSDGNLIAHNTIHDMPHHAINLGTNGYGRNIVEYNHIRRTCLVLQDNGAINAWMDRFDISEEGHISVVRNAERAGHVLRYNYISDSPQGFYLDDWTSNCLVYGNIIVRCGRGITIHGGKNNLIESNVLAWCQCGIFHSCVNVTRPSGRSMIGFGRGNRSRNNIMYETPVLFKFRRHEIERDSVGKEIVESQYNVFFNRAGDYRICINDATPGISGQDHMLPLEAWRALGYDTCSVIADPLFLDPKHDDFRLRPDSPVPKAGFQSTSAYSIGVRARK